MSKVVDVRSRMPGGNSKRDVSQIKKLARHHSGTEEGDAISFANHHTRPVAQGGNGWSTSGYHEVIPRNGDVQICYDPTVITNGVGDHNSGTYHICVVGNGSFTAAQEKAYYERAAAAIKRFNLSVSDNLGHNEFADTSRFRHSSNACPGINMNTVRSALRAGHPVGQAKQTSSESSSTTFTNLSANRKYAEIENAVENVRHLQNYLIAAGYPLPRFGADGKPGAETLGAIQDFRQAENISSPSGDNYGRPGPATMRRLRQLVSYGGIRRANSPYPRGNDVRAVQRVVGVTDDSIYGPITANAVRRYQATNSLGTDGVVGPETWGHMFG